MSRNKAVTGINHRPSQVDVPVWMGALVVVAALTSFALACGMPFVAIGALTALTLVWRDALILAGLAWFTNKILGFGFLNYPLDPLTLTWGLPLGLSALAAIGGAMLSIRLLGAASLANLQISFVDAWASQQTAVFVASLLLGASETPFAPSVLWFFFWTNAVAFSALIPAQAVGARVGLARPIASAQKPPANA